MTDVPIEGLIETLGADLAPVDRLPSPAVRAATWLGVVLGVALLLACFADLHGMAHRLEGAPDMWLAVLGSALTAVLAAVSTFELSLPDRRPLWAFLPLPALALWILASGMGCLRGWTMPGEHGASLGEARTCFTFIVGLSAPLSVLTLGMIRKACPLHPSLTAAIAGLAVASAAATLLNFFHPYDVAATDLAVHAAAVALVVGINQGLAGRLLGKVRAPAIGAFAR